MHLRADGLFVVRREHPYGGFGSATDAAGVNVPKNGDKQDFLALNELMTTDRARFHDDIAWISGSREPAPSLNLPKVAAAPNLIAVRESLVQARKLRPVPTVAVLNTDDDVPYAEMIAAFQLARDHGYRILLAGGPPNPDADSPPPPRAAPVWEAGTIPGTPIIVGDLTRADIEAVVKRNINQLRYCYQRELVKSPSLAGRITVKFVITKDGSVSSATTKASTLHSTRVESCLNARFMRFTFPEPKSGGLVIVSYPFTFSSE